MSGDFEHIVIGAGISGLGLAHRAARKGIETLVLERAERVGGCMNSRTFAQCGDFWTEAGSHTCFNSYGHLLDTLSELGMMGQLTPKQKLRYSLWRDGERRSIFSALHPLEIALSLPKLFGAGKTGRAVADYYGAGLGRHNYRDLFGPAFRAVICQEADEFPAELLFRRKPRRKEVMRSFTLPGGLSEIPRAIASQEGIEVQTGQQVEALQRDGDGFRIRMADGSELASRYLTLAVPPDTAAALLSDGLEELGSALRAIAVTKVESVALCVAKEQVEHLPPSAGLIAVDDAFYSMVARDYLADERYRGFTFHFRPGALDADAQVALIAQVLGIAADRICALARVTNRLPALRVGHEDIVRRIDSILAQSRLAVTGNWFYGVSIEDCLSRSHRECERLFGGQP